MSKLMEKSEHFEIKVSLRQGCVMSPWLFNIHMDGVMRKVKGKVGEVGVKMYDEGSKRALISNLFAENCRKKGTYKNWSVFFILYVK